MVIVILVAKELEYDFSRARDLVINYIGNRYLVGTSFPNIIFNTTISKEDMEQIANRIDSSGMSPIFLEASQEFIDSHNDKYLYFQR